MIQRPLAVNFLVRHFHILIVCAAAVAISWSSISAQSSLQGPILPGDLTSAAAAGNQQRPQIARVVMGFWRKESRDCERRPNI